MAGHHTVSASIVTTLTTGVPNVHCYKSKTANDPATKDQEDGDHMHPGSSSISSSSHNKEVTLQFLLKLKHIFKD
jgi:hypothetical protein